MIRLTFIDFIEYFFCNKWKKAESKVVYAKLEVSMLFMRMSNEQVKIITIIW